MSDEHHDRVTQIFLDVVKLPPDERARYLDRVCPGDDTLRSEIEELLLHDRRAATILEPGVTADLVRTVSAPPETIGPYRVLNVIGEGGMGVVYRARQEQPIRREVALKLIKLGLETRRVVARFESERQVLALMDHPNIARIVDAGTTGAGQPYFAMEYVDGQSLTRFCDRRRLNIRERLGLFLDVCDAVQHAHQNAIIHRDIKPSNILVAVRDGNPVAKIIDFGIAKALAPELAVDTRTEAGHLIGTPDYMSPEQAARNPNIDIRTDIYSLGAVLYELLTGEPPFDFSQVSDDELRRIVREEDPLTPSARVSGMNDSGDRVIRDRRIDRRSLQRELHGDLSLIVMKALEKERGRRYPTALALAVDIRRYLQDQPIEARAPSLAYRFRKLVRRHRTAAALVAVLAPLVLIAAGAMVAQARQITVERDRAEEISEVLVGLYEVPFFFSERQYGPTALDLLLNGATVIEEQLGSRPTLQARMMHATGTALRSVGSTARAVELLDQAHLQLAEVMGPDHPRTLAAANDMALALADLGRKGEAAALFRDTADRRERVLGNDDLETIRSRRDLGALLHRSGKSQDAVSWLTGALEKMRKVLGPDHPETLSTASVLGSAHVRLDRVDDAVRLLSQTVSRMATDHDERRFALLALACAHAQRGERAAALARLTEAVDAGFDSRLFAFPQLRPLFDDPEFVALSRRARLAVPAIQAQVHARLHGHVREGRFREAEAILWEVIENAPADVVPWYSFYLADLRLRQGRYEDSAQRIREFLRWHDGSPEGTPGRRAVYRWFLAQAYLGAGNLDAAVETLEESLELLEDDPRVLGLRHHAIADLAAIRGDHAKALEHIDVAIASGFFEVERMERDLALLGLHDHPRFRAALERLGERYDYP